MDKFTQLFLYVPGVIIFLVGTGMIRTDMALRRLGACVEASVVSCNHVIKKDRKDREVYNYYSVVVDFFNGQNMDRLTVKSPTEYSEGQQVMLFRKKNEDPKLISMEDESLFGGWPTAIGGALMILLALYENMGKEVAAMICLALILIGAGAILLYQYFRLKKRGLQPIEATVIELFTRQISKSTKILRGDKFTYYPIVSYELNGKRNIRRCNINSSGEKTFKVGDKMTVYYDPKKRVVIEKSAKLSLLLWGAALLVAGVASGISILAVIL